MPTGKVGEDLQDGYFERIEAIHDPFWNIGTIDKMNTFS